MGTTIRRQPITNSIPASPDYKFLNITNFGGIEKSSNPFVVSSNTSSDCLNLYVDEDNALTTRPRLEQTFKRHGSYEKTIKATIMDDGQFENPVSNSLAVVGDNNVYVDGIVSNVPTRVILNISSGSSRVGHVTEMSPENIRYNKFEINAQLDGSQNEAVVEGDYVINKIYVPGLKSGVEATFEGTLTWSVTGLVNHFSETKLPINDVSGDDMFVIYEPTEDGYIIIKTLNLYGATLNGVITQIVTYSVDFGRAVRSYALPLTVTMISDFDNSISDVFTIEKPSRDGVVNIRVTQLDTLTGGFTMECVFTQTLQTIDVDFVKETSLGKILRQVDKQWFVNDCVVDNTKSLPAEQCVVFEHDNTSYVLGDSYYKYFEKQGSMCSTKDVAPYIPTVTIGKQQGLSEGTSYESLNILSDYYKETYFWDKSAKGIPDKNVNSDVIKNIGYSNLILPNGLTLPDLKIIKMFDNHFIAMTNPSKHANSDRLYVYCGHFIDDKLEKLDVVTYFANPAKTKFLRSVGTNEDYVFIITSDGVLSVYKYVSLTRTYEQINISLDPILPSRNLKDVSVSDDGGFICITYATDDKPNVNRVICYRITYSANSLTLNRLFDTPGTSASLGDISSEYTIIQRYDVPSVGYYFLFASLCKDIDTGNFVVFAGTISEVPYHYDVSLNPVYTLTNISISNPIENCYFDTATQTLTAVGTSNTGKKIGMLIDFNVEVLDTTTSNPYKINVKTTQANINSKIKEPKKLMFLSDSTLSLVGKNDVYVTDELSNFDELKSMGFDKKQIIDFEFTRYLYYVNDDNAVVLSVYDLEKGEPEYEVTRSINSSKYNYLDILKLRNILKQSNTTTTFDGERWFASKNVLFHTENKDMSYVPYSNHTYLGDTNDNITGMCIINDNVMAVFKEHKIYLVTPTVVQNTRTYIHTESKNTESNDILNAPIITTLTEMPLLVSYNGVYALNQLENVQSSDRISTLISGNINPLWLKEEKHDLDNCKTINILYWTLFIIPLGENNCSKIYLLDNRTQQWYYWEVPVYVIYANVKNNELYITDIQGNEYVFRKSDLINEYNTDVTEYYDKINGKKHIIPWHWYSQILSLNTINYSKKLIDTTFILTDTDTQDEYALDYSFKAWRKSVSETNATTINNNIHYVKSTTKRTMIPRFNFIQFRLNNTEDDLDNNKLRLVGLGLKYVLLEGLY